MENLKFLTPNLVKLRKSCMFRQNPVEEAMIRDEIGSYFATANLVKPRTPGRPKHN